MYKSIVRTNVYTMCDEVSQGFALKVNADGTADIICSAVSSGDMAVNVLVENVPATKLISLREQINASIPDLQESMIGQRDELTRILEFLASQGNGHQNGQGDGEEDKEEDKTEN